MSIEKSLQSMIEFHCRFRIPISVNHRLPSEERRSLRVSLLLDEVEELRVSDDPANDAREMADIEAVACGTLLEYGLWLDIRHLEVQPMSGVWGAAIAYRDAEFSDDVDAIQKALVCVLRTNRIHADRTGVPLDAVFAEVHRTNMAKLNGDGEPIYRDDGKVLKPPGWTPPDIEGVLQRARELVG